MSESGVVTKEAVKGGVLDEGVEEVMQATLESTGVPRCVMSLPATDESSSSEGDEDM